MGLVLSVVQNVEELVHTLFFRKEMKGGGGVGGAFISLVCCSECRGASEHFCSLGQR